MQRYFKTGCQKIYFTFFGHFVIATRFELILFQNATFVLVMLTLYDIGIKSRSIAHYDSSDVVRRQMTSGIVI